VIEKFAEGTTLSGSSSIRDWISIACFQCYSGKDSRLTTIYSIKGLVRKKPNSPGIVDPGWAILVHTRGVIEHCQQIHNDKTESAQGDL
jgi:hypothetical protein